MNRMQESNLTDVLKELGYEMQALTEQQLLIAKPEAEFILSNKITDIDRIDRTLDLFWDILRWGKGDELFLKLLDYLDSLDADAAQFYKNEYEKMKNEK